MFALFRVHAQAGTLGDVERGPRLRGGAQGTE